MTNEKPQHLWRFWLGAATVLIWGLVGWLLAEPFGWLLAEPSQSHMTTRENIVSGIGLVTLMIAGVLTLVVGASEWTRKRRDDA